MNGTESPERLTHNGERVRVAWISLQKGTDGLGNLPKLLKQIVWEEMYKEFVIDGTGGEVQENATFTEFVTSTPPKGLGTTGAMIRRLCADDPEALNAVDEAMTGKPGDNQYTKVVDNINNHNRTTGTSSAYALRKLKKDSPVLFQAVIEKKISANAAMVEAGFRIKTITIPLDPEKAARSISKHFSRQDINILIGELGGVTDVEYAVV